MGISGYIIYKDYEKLKCLGSGTYGTVYQIHDIKDNKIYAIKEIPKGRVKIKDIKNETNILSKFNNESIVKYYGLFYSEDNFIIKMEYCESNLAKFIEDRKNELINENILYKIINNICLGINEIHSKQIIHRDLNPNNIFMNKDYNIKIGDFGISKIYVTTKTNVGTIKYMAPELVGGGGVEYNNKVDIWALGCILYELFTLKNCFYCENNVLGTINNIIYNDHGKIGEKYNKKWQDIIDLCLKKNHQERPGIDEIICLIKNLGKNMQIFIRIIGIKDVIALDVESSDTIKSIKEKIENKEGIIPEKQKLIFNGKNLVDNKTLEDYKIENESTFYLFHKNIKIFIQIFLCDKKIMKTIELDVESNDTILDIKKQIYDKERIPIEQQKLFLYGEQLENLKSISFYKIKKNSIIILIQYNQIYINISGVIITLDVLLSDTIKNIKKKIYDKERIPIEQQKLFLDGIQLEDGKSISSYNIRKESSIILIQHNQINVKTISGKIITLDLKSSNTISDMKMQIYNKEGIPIKQQKLFLDNLDGTELDDFNTISFYNIQNTSVIILIYNIHIFVRSISGKGIILDVNSTDIIRNIKEQIYDKEGIPIKQQKLFLENNLEELKEDYYTIENYNIRENSSIYLEQNIFIIFPLNEKKICLNVISSDTIIKIKEKIKHKEGILPNEYKLILNEKVLVEYKILADYNISENSIIYLKFYEKFDIFINFPKNEKKICLNVISSETIIKIKEKIKEKDENLSYKYKLIFNKEELKDYKTLDNYNIDHNSTINLKFNEKFNIFIRFENGKKICLNVELFDTIIKIKQKIKDEVENFSNKYNLIFNEEELEDFKTLDYYNINGNSIIYLFKEKFNIFINFPKNEKKICLNVLSSDTIIKIKEKIKDKEGFFSKVFKLIFNEEELDENKTLDDYNISKNSIIDLKFNEKFNIFIIFENRKKISLNIEAFDTIIKIKEEIKNKEGISLNEFKLIFNEKVLEENKTLDYYNISENSNIYFISNSLKQIIIKTSGENSFILNVKSTDKIKLIKNVIRMKIKDLFDDSYSLNFNGKILEDDKTLEDYNVQNLSILHFYLTLRLRGGFK